MSIGYGSIQEKNDINLTKIREKAKRILKKKDAEEHFKLPLFQKDCSDNNYLPSRGLFTLPIEFVNLLYNYAEKKGLKKKELALQDFLTHQINAREILGFVRQRGEDSDNQSRRLHNAIAYQIQEEEPGENIVDCKKEAKRIIEKKGDELMEYVQKAIDEGKRMYAERAKAERAA